MAAAAVCLVLICWLGGPAEAVEIRLVQDLDANTTFMAPRPAPPETEPGDIPKHNCTMAAHNYTHAVVGRSKHKAWIRQLHYRVGDKVKVDKVVLTVVFNDTKKDRLYLRGRTADGSGVCLVELPKNATKPENTTQAANTTQTANSTESVNTTKSAIDSRPFRETLVSLEGPTEAKEGLLAALCRPLHVYTIHQMPPRDHGHDHPVRSIFKMAMRSLAFIWRNRHILGLPFGVKGDFEYGT